MKDKMIKQGAEAKIYSTEFFGKPAIVKERFAKKYRHPQLDENLSKERTKSEAKCLFRCRTIGGDTPALYWVDTVTNRIYMEDVNPSITVKEYINSTPTQQGDGPGPTATLAAKIGQTLGKMHSHDIIHGDLTTSNMLLRLPAGSSSPVMIDFGLSYVDCSAEDKGVDLYVLEKALQSTHPGAETLFNIILSSYCKEYPKGSVDVVKKLDEVRLRGRKRTMVG